MSNPYDAIIIGTGAGGGPLALHLAQAGKRILILERGPFLPQEKLSTGPPRRSSFPIAITPARPGMTRRAKTCTHSRLTSSAARPKSTVPPCSVCGRRISASFSTRAASPPPGPSPTPISNPSTPKPKNSSMSTAISAPRRPSWEATEAASIPPSRFTRSHTLTQPSRMNRACRPSRTTCAAWA